MTPSMNKVSRKTLGAAGRAQGRARAREARARAREGTEERPGREGTEKDEPGQGAERPGRECTEEGRRVHGEGTEGARREGMVVRKDFDAPSQLDIVDAGFSVRSEQPAADQNRTDMPTRGVQSTSELVEPL